MMYLLDTNICIFALKGDKAVVENLQRADARDLAVSTITLAELWFGAKKCNHPVKVRKLQDAFLEPFAILDFNEAAAERYAEIRLRLEKRGMPIGERDQLIAAIALAHKRILATNNLREFQRISDLGVVDWKRPIA